MTRDDEGDSGARDDGKHLPGPKFPLKGKRADAHSGTGQAAHNHGAKTQRSPGYESTDAHKQGHEGILNDLIDSGKPEQ